MEKKSNYSKYVRLDSPLRSAPAERIIHGRPYCVVEDFNTRDPPWWIPLTMLYSYFEGRDVSVSDWVARAAIALVVVPVSLACVALLRCGDP